MENAKRTVLGSGLLWLGAAISIAEIYTGTLIAPLGMAKGTMAVVLGHAVGGSLMYLAAMIGANTGKGAMESVKISFGEAGAKFFAILNVLQLVGWTAVMIVGGACALGVILGYPDTHGGTSVLSAAIGAMIAVWILLDIKRFERANKFAMAGLFLLTLVLSSVVFGPKGVHTQPGTMSFGTAMELSAAMPLSWLPLISDYIRDARAPKMSAAVSSAVYFAASCWMYVIGMGAAIYTGESDIARIMLSSGLGLAGAVIVVLSTVTTTFLDAYSGGVSFSVVVGGVKEKAAAVAICAIGTLLAVTVPVESYESYLYLISSVFGPMISVMIVDYFILRKTPFEDKLCLKNILIWTAGFVFYRLFAAVYCPIGNTLPVMAATMALAYVADKTARVLRRA